MAGSNTATATMCGHKALVYNIGEAQHNNIDMSCTELTLLILDAYLVLEQQLGYN